MEFSKENIKIEVIKSECALYKAGDKIIINGPLVNLKETDAACVTALLSVWPFVYAMRKGVPAEKMGFSGRVTVQCPDYCAPVVFEVSPLEP